MKLKCLKVLCGCVSEADLGMADRAICEIGISYFRLDHSMFASLALLIILLLYRTPTYYTSSKVRPANLTIRSNNTNSGITTFTRTGNHLFVMVRWWMTRENVHRQSFVFFLFFVCGIGKVFQFDEGSRTLFVVPGIECT